VFASLAVLIFVPVAVWLYLRRRRTTAFAGAHPAAPQGPSS
jgi:hypothetical protein